MLLCELTFPFAGIPFLIINRGQADLDGSGRKKSQHMGYHRMDRRHHHAGNDSCRK